MLRSTRRAVTALAALLVPHAAIAQGVRWISTPVEIRVPKPPIAAPINGALVLPYELHVTNWATQPFLLKRVEVTSAGADGRVYLALADSALGRALGRPGMTANTSGDRMRLGGGMRAVGFDEAHAQLAARGVICQLLELTEAGDWRFTCYIRSRQNPNVRRKHIATARTELAAMQAALEQIDREN
jgi:hypothetical protein